MYFLCRCNYRAVGSQKIFTDIFERIAQAATVTNGNKLYKSIKLQPLFANMLTFQLVTTPLDIAASIKNTYDIICDELFVAAASSSKR